MNILAKNICCRTFSFLNREPELRWRDILEVTLLHNIIVTFEYEHWSIGHATAPFVHLCAPKFPRSLLFQCSDNCLSVTIWTGT